MKTFRKILAVCFALLMVLSMTACKDKKEAEKKASSQEIVSSASSVVHVLCDAEIYVGFDEDGKALALYGFDEAGKQVAEKCEDIAGMSGTEAVNEVLKVLIKEDFLLKQPYIVLRQDHYTALPSEDFLDTLAKGAEEVLDGAPLITITVDDMDKDGLFNEDVATKIMETYLSSNDEIVTVSPLLEGSYIVTCIENDTEVVYSLSAYTGAMALYSDLVGDNALTEEELIPESDQLGGPTDDEKNGITTEAESDATTEVPDTETTTSTENADESAQ